MSERECKKIIIVAHQTARLVSFSIENGGAIFSFFRCHVHCTMCMYCLSPFGSHMILVVLPDFHVKILHTEEHCPRKFTVSLNICMDTTGISVNPTWLA